MQPSASFRGDDQVASEEVKAAPNTSGRARGALLFPEKTQKCTGRFNETGGDGRSPERRKQPVVDIRLELKTQQQKAGTADELHHVLRSKWNLESGMTRPKRRTRRFWFQFSSSFRSSFSFRGLKNQRLISFKSLLVKSVIRTRKVRRVRN